MHIQYNVWLYFKCNNIYFIHTHIQYVQQFAHGVIYGIHYFIYTIGWVECRSHTAQPYIKTSHALYLSYLHTIGTIYAIIVFPKNIYILFWANRKKETRRHDDEEEEDRTNRTKNTNVEEEMKKQKKSRNETRK